MTSMAPPAATPAPGSLSLSPFPLFSAIQQEPNLNSLFAADDPASSRTLLSLSLGCAGCAREKRRKEGEGCGRFKWQARGSMVTVSDTCAFARAVSIFRLCEGASCLSLFAVVFFVFLAGESVVILFLG